MIRSLSLTNFRSYKSIQLEFDKSLTVICGPNAVGKTNLLESIFVASTTRSFRAADKELIHNGEEFYKVEADFEDTTADIIFSSSSSPSPTATSSSRANSKQLKLNKKRHSLSSLLGRNPVTLFEPNDMNLFAHSPSNRRRYLDIVLSQSNPRYVTALSQYKHILRQRNSLLHRAKVTHKPLDHDELFIWDLQMAENGKVVVSLRSDLVRGLNPFLQDSYNTIAGRITPLSLVYSPSIDTTNQDFLDALKQNEAKDEIVGFSTVGPHRDDICINFKGGDINDVASRGETRTVILALKLAELHYIEQLLSKRPILLLDDVFSELDPERRAHLMQMIAHQQTFITTTELSGTIPKTSYIIDLSGAK